MRNFNDYEKSILDKLSQVDPEDLITISRFISDSVFTVESGLALVFIPARGEALLYLKGTLEDAINRKRMVQFIELVSLIEYLRSERYLHKIDSAAGAEFFIIGEEFDDISQNAGGDIVLNNSGLHIKPSDAGWIYNSEGGREYQGLIFKKNDSSLYEVISSFISSPLVPAQELKDFVNNKYRTKEDIRYSQSSFYTWLAIGIAIIFGVISTVIGVAPLISGCN